MRLEREQKMERSYSFMAKLMHWTFPGVFVYGVLIAVDEVEELERDLRHREGVRVEELGPSHLQRRVEPKRARDGHVAGMRVLAAA